MAAMAIHSGQTSGSHGAGTRRTSRHRPSTTPGAPWPPLVPGGTSFLGGSGGPCCVPVFLKTTPYVTSFSHDLIATNSPPAAPSPSVHVPRQTNAHAHGYLLFLQRPPSVIGPVFGALAFPRRL